MILKAGTYRFNDVLKEAEFNQDIDFTIDGIADGISFSVYCSNLRGGVKSFLDGTITWVLSIFEDKYIEDGEENVLGIEVDVYKGTAGWITSPAEGIVHTIPKDTEVDDAFGTWYKANTDYDKVNGGETPEEPETPTKKFTRLYLGKVAHSSNGKRFRKLQTEEYVEPSEPEDTESIIGTWVFKDTIIKPSSELSLEFTATTAMFTTNISCTKIRGETGIAVSAYAISCDPILPQYGTPPLWIQIYNADSTFSLVDKKINVIKETSDDNAKTWLKANATRVEESVVGTWLLNEIIPVNDVTITVPRGDIQGTFYGKETDSSTIVEKSLDRVRINTSTSSYSFYMNSYITDTSYIQTRCQPSGTWTTAYIAEGSNNVNSVIPNAVNKVKLRTLTITNLADGHEDFVAWLKANATKQ